MFKICGESSEVQGETVICWKEQLSEIVQRYLKHNIWNMNEETGLFFRALSDRGFAKKRQSCCFRSQKEDSIHLEVREPEVLVGGC